jgi:hypothetical protein
MRSSTLSRKIQSVHMFPINVQPTPMQKHAGHERPVIVDGEAKPKRPLRVRVTHRHNAEYIKEPFDRFWRKAEFKKKRQTVREDQATTWRLAGFCVERYLRSVSCALFAAQHDQLEAGVSTFNSFSTSTTPGTPRAAIKASCLSISVATTPFNVARPFSTMMWMGGTD